MSDQLIKPDLNFVKDVIASGGESLKKCFQCATCSVVCNLSPDDKPFPRKEMIYAQWGLKDKLFSNPDIWLCHHCSDCTAYCPRGAKPGEVIGAVRKLAIQNYSVPRFLGRALGSPSYLILLFAIPVAILLAVLASLGHLDLSAIPRGEGGAIVYSKFMPEIYIEVIYIAISLFAALILAHGVFRCWAGMMAAGGIGRSQMKKALLSTIVAIIVEILLHRRFAKCVVTKGRQISHLLVLYSFIGLAITAAWGVFYLYVLGWHSPYPLTNPMKWLGNAGALALLIGITLTVINRSRNKEKAGIGSYFDWLLITVVAAIAVTGMGAQCLRLADVAVLAYLTYFLHLVFVFFLFAYAPYSKMAHMVYRTVAMVFAKHAEKGVEVTPLK